MTYRALAVTPLFTITDTPGHPAVSVRKTPSETWSQGVGALLDRVARTFDGAGVLVLDRAAAHGLKLPSGPDDPVTVGLDDARSAGWLVRGKVRPWTTFYADGRPDVVLCLPAWPGFYDRSPLGNPQWLQDTVHRLSMWHKLSGSAWVGTPGVAAMQILRATAPRYPVRGKQVGPSFNYPEGPDGAQEMDYEPEDWSIPQAGRYAHGYDASRMYLAAAQGCEVLAPWSLKHTGRIEFDPKKAGWWRVKLGPWNHPRIPAPAGPGEDERWVTTPTLVLLRNLLDAGDAFQPFEVLDSYTAPGKRVLRNWAETIERTYQGARSFAEAGDPDVVDGDGTTADGAAVMAAAKSAYKEGWGLLNYISDQGVRNAIYRPDWHYAILAQARSNLWRRMWQVGHAEGRWPVEIKVDHVWYESDSPDPIEAKPSGIPLVNKDNRTDTLGTFKPKGTREKVTP